MHVIIPVLIYLLHWIHLSAQTDCTLKEPTPERNLMLARLNPLKGKEFKISNHQHSKNGTKYTYKVGVCTTVSPSADVGATQQAESEKDPVALGKFSECRIIGGVNWIMLTYMDGKNYSNHCGKSSREATIMFTCNPEVLEGEFQMIEENMDDTDNCFYLFHIDTSAVCPAKRKDDGLSSGSVFCIIFFTFTGLYLLLGFLYQRIVVGAKGLEQIPNYTFWKDFGGLQADGCDFICRCGQRSEMRAYREIDEQLEKEDIDDRLLSM